MIYNQVANSGGGGGSTTLNPQTPVGTINGVTTVFTTTGTVNAVFLNGIFQPSSGANQLVTIAAGSITYVTAPETGMTHFAI